MITRYQNGSQLAGLIYIHRISDKRFSGISGRNFKIFRELCGETSLKNVVIVTNMWGDVSYDVGKDRERELASKFLKPALNRGAQMVYHHNTEQSTHTTNVFEQRQSRLRLSMPQCSVTSTACTIK